MKYNCGYILNKVIEGLDDLTEYYHWDGDDEIFQLEDDELSMFLNDVTKVVNKIKLCVEKNSSEILAELQYD